MISVELEKLMLWREIQKVARELIAIGAGDVRLEREITDREVKEKDGPDDN